MHAQGYIPVHGYSFTRSKAPDGAPRAVVHRSGPLFLYHEIFYGYAEDYIDGYGANAISTLGSYLVHNIENREQYAVRLLSNRQQLWFKAYDWTRTGGSCHMYSLGGGLILQPFSN